MSNENKEVETKALSSLEKMRRSPLYAKVVESNKEKGLQVLLLLNGFNPKK